MQQNLIMKFSWSINYSNAAIFKKLFGNLTGTLGQIISVSFCPVLPLENVAMKDPPDLLDRQKCLNALASLRHAKWFQVGSLLLFIVTVVMCRFHWAHLPSNSV